MVVPYENVSKAELRMIPYVIKTMLRHVIIRMVLTATFTTLIKKRSRTEYNIQLTRQHERLFLISAALIGIVFGALVIWLVVMIKGQENIVVVIAGILLAIGLVQQITSLSLDSITLNLNNFISSWNSVINLLAKQFGNPEWRFIEKETEEIFIFPQILYVLPPELDGLKPARTEIVKYLDERKWEVDFHSATLYHDDHSLLSFAQHAAENIRDRLHVYDRISTIQQRTGAVNPVVFVALGTLIWLLS